MLVAMDMLYKIQAYHNEINGKQFLYAADK